MSKPPTNTRQENPLHLLDQLDQLLPQTQCQRCGYPACKPYAEAMLAGQAGPNLCPPGGQDGADALAHFLKLEPVPLDTSRGTPGVTVRARIVEAMCIGCTKCIRACPVDAIIGGNKRMHTVIAGRCTGCELCLPPCPTDCIVLEPQAEAFWTPALAGQSRERYKARQRRLGRQGADAPQAEAEQAPGGTPPDFVARALALARQRLAAQEASGSSPRTQGTSHARD